MRKRKERREFEKKKVQKKRKERKEQKEKSSEKFELWFMLSGFEFYLISWAMLSFIVICNDMRLELGDLVMC